MPKVWDYFFKILETKQMTICEALLHLGLSEELAVNFSVIAFRFFSEREREGKYLRAVSLH
jgi:hypothetical protein